MNEFEHFIHMDGFTYEVTGKIDVSKGMDGLVIDSVKEYKGLGLGNFGAKRLDISDDLKETVIGKFMEETQALFDERDARS